MKKGFTLFFFALLAACATPSERLAASDVCDGQVALVRVAQIREGGSVAGVEQAVVQHQRWYRDRGYSENDIFIARVLERQGDQYAVSATEVATLHLSPPVRREGEATDDPAWGQFVAQYRANEVETEPFILCLPRRLR